MANKVYYYSTDKLYKVKKRKRNKRLYVDLFCIITTIILFTTSVILFKNSVVIGGISSGAQYSELGDVNYKVYLKDNDFYESSYLDSGLQYVADLIKTINVKFNYEIHTTEDLDFANDYKVVSELQITERDDPSSILYTKKENLVPLTSINMRDDNLVINQEVDIDYDKYNTIVDNYKRNLGLIVSSNLILTFETNTEATNKSDKLQKDNKLQMIIPLSEATIKMNREKLDNSDVISVKKTNFNINNKVLFVLSIVSIIITGLMIALDIYVYWKHLEKDPYKIKINNILKNYDRLIVTGNINLDESKYSNIIHANTFKELVDAAENYGVPIMHYEVIRGEKSIFIVTKDDTLVKYRVTKAYLNNKKNKEEIIG